MDATDDYLTDSDLSEIEELLEESYAEAMKRVQTFPHTSQEVGAEMEITGEEEVTKSAEDKQVLPKADVVIDYDKSNEVEENKTETDTDSKVISKAIEDKQDEKIDEKEPEKLLNSEDINEKEESEQIKTNEIEKDAEGDRESGTNSVECMETEIIDDDESKVTDSQNVRKKKRFRNLITPEPNGTPSQGFKGFEDQAKSSENIETNPKPQPVKETKETVSEKPTSSEKDNPPEAFKSPSKSHQSLKDKHKDKSSSDSKEKSVCTKSENKKPGDSSKDRNSRESSKDKKSSRDNSKDRSSSKDRSRHSSRESKDSKHHHQDHRRSSDSKDSSKSRESSKSRDCKETNKDLAKKDQAVQKEKSSDEKRSVKPQKDIVKSSSGESKSSSKDDYKKDSKEHKSSSDKKSFEVYQKSAQKDKEISKSSNTTKQDTKPNKDMNKSLTSKSSTSSMSRESSKDRKSINKMPDSTKSSTETKKAEKTKESTAHNTSVKDKTATSSVKEKSSMEEAKGATKISTEKSKTDKDLKINESNKEKKILQSPKASSADLKISKSSESASKDSSNVNKQANTNTTKINTVDLTKQDTSIATKAVSDQKEKAKTSHISDSSKETKTQIPSKHPPKEIAGSKQPEGSVKKPNNPETKNTKLIDKQKTPVKIDQTKSKEKSSDFKKPTENLKTPKETDPKNISMSPKPSNNSKEIIKNTEISKGENKKLEISKDKKLEDGKVPEKTLGKLVENKPEGSKTKTLVVKSSSDVVKKDAIKTESNANKSSKTESNKADLSNTKKSSEKQQAALKKEDLKAIPKKQDSNAKSNDNPSNRNKIIDSQKKMETNKTHQNSPKPETKTLLPNKSSSAGSIIKGDVTASTTPKAEKVNITKTPQKEQQKTTITPKINQGKAESSASNKTSTKTQAQISKSQTITNIKTKETASTNKAALKDNKEKIELKASISSPKTLKNPQVTVPKTKIEESKTGQKDQQHSPPETKIKEVVITPDKEADHMKEQESKDHQKASESILDSNVVIKNKEETEVENLDGTKETTKNTDSEKEDVIIAEPIEDKNENNDGDNCATTSVKARSIMETVLTKSVVILIEPLKSKDYPHLIKNAEEDIEVETKTTPEDHLKETDTGKKETKIPKASEEKLLSEDLNKTENDKTKEMVLKTDAKETESAKSSESKNDYNSVTKIEIKHPKDKSMDENTANSEEIHLKTSSIKLSDEKHEGEGQEKTELNSQESEDKKISKVNIKCGEAESNLETSKSDSKTDSKLDEKLGSGKSEQESLSSQTATLDKNNISEKKKLGKTPIKKAKASVTDSQNKTDKKIDSAKHGLKESHKLEQKTDLKIESPSQDKLDEKLLTEDKKSEQPQTPESVGTFDTIVAAVTVSDEIEPKGDMKTTSESEKTTDESTAAAEKRPEQVKTRKQTDQKSEIEKHGNQSSENSSDKAIEGEKFVSETNKIQTQTDLKTETESKDSSDEKLATKDQKSKRIQTRRKADTQSETKTSETDVKEKSEITVESERHVSESPKLRRKAGLRKDSENQIIAAENIVSEGKKSERTQSRKNPDLKSGEINVSESIKTQCEVDLGNKNYSTEEKNISEDKKPERYQTRQKADIKSEDNASEKDLTEKAVQSERDALQSPKLRRKADLRKEGKIRNECDERVTPEGKKPERTQTRSNADLKSEKKLPDTEHPEEQILSEGKSTGPAISLDNNKSDDKSDKVVESQEHNLESIVDLKTVIEENKALGLKRSDRIQTRKKSEIKTSETDSEDKSIKLVESEDKQLEPVRTRRKADLKTESAIKETNEGIISQTEDKSKSKTGTEMENENRTVDEACSSERIQTRNKPDKLKSKTCDIENKDKPNKKLVSGDSQSESEREEKNSERIRTRRKDVVQSEEVKTPLKAFGKGSKETLKKGIASDESSSESKKAEIENAEINDEKSEKDSDNVKPVVTRQKANLNKSEREGDNENSEMRSVETRQKVNLKSELSNKNATDNEVCCEGNSENKEAKSEPVKTVQKTDLETSVTKPLTRNKKTSESEESGFEPIKSRRKAGSKKEPQNEDNHGKLNESSECASKPSKHEIEDTKATVSKKAEAQLSTRQQGDEDKNTIASTSEETTLVEGAAKIGDDKVEPKRTRSRVNLVEEDSKSETNKSEATILIEVEEERVEPVRTRSRVELVEKDSNTEANKSEASVTKVSTLTESGAKTEEDKIEPKRSRRRVEPKLEMETEIKRASDCVNVSQAEGRDTRKSQRKTLNNDDGKKSTTEKASSRTKEGGIEHGDASGIQGINEVASQERETEESLKESLRSGRRSNAKEVVEKGKEETDSKFETSFVQKELGENLKPAKTSRRGETPSEKDKSEKLSLQIETVDAGEKQIETDLKKKSENYEKATSEKEFKSDVFEPIRKRLRKDSRTEDEKAHKLEEEREYLTPSRSRRLGNSKENTKELNEKTENIRLRARGDLNSGSEKNVIDDKTSGKASSSSIHVVVEDDKINKGKEVKTDIKATIQKETEEQHLEPRITRSRVDHKNEASFEMKNNTEDSNEVAKTIKVISTEIAAAENETKQYCQREEKPSEDSQTNRSNEQQSGSSSDKKPVEEIKAQEFNDQVKNKELSEQNTLRLLSEIDRLIQDSSDNDMSGFESSSSSSDTTIRRTLRKRGTDSPFPENDNNKKQFKEPLQKTTTPRSSKTSKGVLNTASLTFKRPLRSPALEADTENPSKRLKLDPTKKSTRFRNLQEDVVDEEVPSASSKSNIVTKVHPQSTSIIRKPTQNENTKEVTKNSSKNTVSLDEKDKGKSRRSAKIQTADEHEQEITIDREISSKNNKSDATTEDKDNTTNATNSPAELKHKSSGSTSVISFSDWLKTKGKSTASESSATSNESAADTTMRQSRTRVKLTAQSKGDLEKTIERSHSAQKKATMINHSLEENQEELIIPESLNENNKSANMRGTDLLQPTDGQQQQKSKENKSNAKLLQTSMNKTKKTSPVKPKKNEIDLLIESMSKEMKDGGITDLLKTEAHVKRQRIVNTRNVSTNALTATLPEKGALNVHNSKQMPNIAGVSDNLEQDTHKSPTRRRTQQNASKNRRSATLRRDGTSTPDVSVLTDHSVATTVDSRSTKSAFARNNEAGDSNLTAVEVVRTRKSMPVLHSELTPLLKSPNVSSRKSLATSRHPQTAISDSDVFKIPKQVGPSVLLSKIASPNAESIKKFYVDNKNKSDGRIKIHQTEQHLLKKFKCRKLAIRLDRTTVQKFLNSKNKRARSKFSKNRSVLTNAASADISPIIQNNSETNLRIQSVVDASAIFNKSPPALMKNTKATKATPVHNTVNSRNTRVGGDFISAQPSILPSSNATVPTQTIPLESIELKNELMDENPVGSINEEILPDTPTLLARAQTITEAAQQALSHSVTPTDIRLLTTDSSESNFVPSFGVVPTALDNRGTCMYTYLHPAKYNRNHSNVLLDYCCPNLDGPMPAIDPTRIHAQVQVPVIELPASIVLTTKVVTRADLESGDTSIPAIIRKKAEKIRKNMATHQQLAVSTANHQQNSPAMFQSTPRTGLPPTVNALTKQLPATTTITAKIRTSVPQPSQTSLQPPSSSAVPTLSKNAVSVIPKTHMSLSVVQQSSLRSNLRRFDVLLKQLVQPYESLSFLERHRIIEAVIASGRCLPKDLEQTLVLMEEYIKQTMLLKNELHTEATAPAGPAIMSTNNYQTLQPVVASHLPSSQMPQLHPSPKILASKTTPAATTTYSSQFEQTINKSIRKVQSRGGKELNSEVSDAVIYKQRQVPIYDTDRNIIGYQMQMMTPMSTMPAYTKSTMSTHSGAIMSTSPDTSITAFKISKKPLKRPAQDSPRVFYTTPPTKTSTPKGHIYTEPLTKSANTIAHKSQGSIVTTMRSAGSSSGASSETITTTTMATVKRVTRSTATGSKIIIVSKSNQSSEETILPDANSSAEQMEQTEIKHEKDIEDFLG